MILLEGLWSREAEKLGVDINEEEVCVIGSPSEMDELKSLSAIQKESLFWLSLFMILPLILPSKEFLLIFSKSIDDFFVNAVMICTLILASNSVNG